MCFPLPHLNFTWKWLESDLWIARCLGNSRELAAGRRATARVPVSKKLFRDISHNMKHATKPYIRPVDFGILNTSQLLYYCFIAEQFCLPSFRLLIHTLAFLSVCSVNFELIQCIQVTLFCVLDCLRRNHAIVQNNQIWKHLLPFFSILGICFSEFTGSLDL